MRTFITFSYNDGMEVTWKVRVASYNDKSRNVVLLDAVSPDGIETPRVLIPLYNVRAVMESKEIRND